jgi:hypothetical protein
MRIADPAELSPEQSLESVLTAIMPRHGIDRLSNAMRDVDQFETPGPAKMAVLKLDVGPMVVVAYHEMKNLIEVLAPIDHAVEDALAELVEVLRIPRTSIEWVREGIELSAVYHDGGERSHPAEIPPTSSGNLLPPTRARNRYWTVTANASVAERPMEASESITLTLLVMRLMHIAGDIEPIGDTAIRMIQLPETILFEDGSEAAPLAVYYTISEDGSTAWIVDVEHLPANKVHVASGTLTSAIEAARVAELDVSG